MRFVCALILGVFLVCRPTAAAIQILMAPPDFRGSSAECTYFFQAVLQLLANRQGMNAENHFSTLKVTKEQIYDTYRALGTVPESEIEELRKEDALFPAQSVLYLRSVSDVDGSVQGIMRLVTNKVSPKYYYNHLFTLSPKPSKLGPAEIPVLHKYPDEAFQKFVRERYPQRTEAGRVVFGKGVNEIRVLVDFCTAIARLSYFPSFSKDHYLIAEAVRPAVHRYEALGMTQVAAPIEFNDGRVLMEIPMKEFYDRYLGSVRQAVDAFHSLPYDDKPARAKAIEKVTQAIEKSSEHGAIQKLYTYGLYERARLYMAADDFKSMLKDVQSIARRNPQDQDIRLLELYAEAGSRFNWVTGEGDWKSAVAFLESPEAKEKFADEKLSEGLYTGNRLFVKGLILLGAGQVKLARQAREEIDALNAAAVQAAAALGKEHWIIPSERYGWMRADELRRRVYDPYTKEGTLGSALQGIDVYAQENPVGISAAIFEYKAQVMRDLGMPEEARAAEKIAKTLKSPAPSGKKARARKP